ncbi:MULTISPECIES: hypothetical protein [Frankia]|uniref:Uncharacterized protein n=1 Tax=Frankia umida TaxID=573489 RepID=A0ABT0JU85_9ACTN|nr:MULTISPECIES: hypothetical protein [Frankia]MCK9875016.1 hypothetical protein [Frankia umida]
MNAAGDPVGQATTPVRTGEPDMVGWSAARRQACLAGAIALLAAFVMLGLAVADPSPSRHVRGLLVTIDVVLLAGAATAWLRVVLALGGTRREPTREDTPRD